MKKKRNKLAWAGGIVLVVGLIVCLGVGIWTNFDFVRLFQMEPAATGVIEQQLDGIDEIVLLGADDIQVRQVEGDTLRLSYPETEQHSYNLTKEGSSLTLTEQGAQNWSQFFLFQFSGAQRQAILEIPKDFAGKVTLQGTTGNVNVEDLSGIIDFTIERTAGDITVGQLQLERLTLATTTGDIRLDNATAENATLNASTGHISIGQLEATETLQCNATTGDVDGNLLKSREIAISTSTGNISLGDIEGEQVTLRATTGDIQGTLAGKGGDYTIHSSTDNGDNNLPESLSGGSKTLDVETDAGDINISFTDA